MKAFGKTLGVVIGLLALLVFGFAWRDLQGGRLPKADTMLALVGASPHKGSSLSSIQIFRQTYHRILDRYAGKVDPEKLKYAAMEGTMASLGDPHTMFLPEEAAETFNLETTAKFVGVGARLTPDALGASVVVVFEEGPGHRAGLRVGDVITAVDGKSVAGVDLGKIVNSIRGAEGSYVSLRVLRSGQDQPVEIRVRREKVIAPTVQGKMIPNTRIGYIEVESFSEPTGAQFDRALDRVQAQGAEGLVIDLRGNPGGLLDTARELLSHFIDDKVVVKMKSRGGREEVVRSYASNGDLVQLPVAILIDEDSASASEIFAGVMRDYKLATLIGEHSYGKAAVQHVFKLKDDSSAKITVAKYLLPSGYDVSRKVDEDGQYVSGGLKPDLPVSLDLSKRPTLGDVRTDNQLQTAVEVLKTKLGRVEWTPDWRSLPPLPSGMDA